MNQKQLIEIWNNLSEVEISKEGKLHFSNSGGAFSWKKRYFILKSNLLAIFQDKSHAKESNAKEIIVLHSSILIGYSNSISYYKKKVFQITRTDQSILYLCSDSQKENEDWVHTLRNARKKK
ncbi:hypothetical protein M0811_14514 [Anaeramoeba ignava]|nr:hypothetical protein M0811_14514 [Anaeramoeba ignava]